MIDFADVERYRENNRIEAKKALGGLPHSIWETYSAFANTLGGIILLGVEEYRDKSFHAVDLPDPQRMIAEFKQILNDGRRVSVNILSDKDISVETVQGKHIIAIRVPRAARYDKPVFVGGELYGGTYRRNGEGDYKCSREEIAAMQRDAAADMQDAHPILTLDESALNTASVLRYRALFTERFRVHAWHALSDTAFLQKLCALAADAKGMLHPTAAGLLMFGNYDDIKQSYPHYALYDKMVANGAKNSRQEPFCGNLFDFYESVCAAWETEAPAFLNKSDNGAENRVITALQEALSNCLSNADYYGEGGIVVECTENAWRFYNPGSFRVDIEAAKLGGVCDPRNGALVKMFRLMGAGKGVGGGLSGIFETWYAKGWSAPEITEMYHPARVCLSLPLDKRAETHTVSPHKAEALQREMIVAYLTQHISATSSELAAYLSCSVPRVRAYLRALSREEVVVATGNTRARRYTLKA